MQTGRSASLKKALGALVDLLYPPTCALCHQRLLLNEQTLCDPCRADLLPEDTWRCLRCGATGEGAGPEKGHVCSYCPPPGASYQGVLAVSRYNERAARCIHLFKYQRRIEIGRLLADIMVARLSVPLGDLEERIEWVVPVPLHWRRRAFRGFNQSDILAERLSEHLNLPMKPEMLRRVRHTKRQVRVPREKRADNVRGAFAVDRSLSNPIPGVLLVDDVVTSGHTVGECARVLTGAGAPQVWVASFARGRPEERDEPEMLGEDLAGMG